MKGYKEFLAEGSFPNTAKLYHILTRAKTNPNIMDYIQQAAMGYLNMNQASEMVKAHRGTKEDWVQWVKKNERAVARLVKDL